MTSLATGLRNAWNTNIAPVVHTSASLTNTSVTDLTSNLGLVGVNSTSAAGTQSSTAPMPANVALVASFKIGRRYRGGHPRMYLVAQTTANTTNSNNWLPAWITSSTTNLTAWMTAVNALTYSSMATIQLVNLSYYIGNALRPTPTFDTISGVQIHSRVDTMRRRLGKEIS